MGKAAFLWIYSGVVSECYCILVRTALGILKHNAGHALLMKLAAWLDEGGAGQQKELRMFMCQLCPLCNASQPCLQGP